MRRYFIQFLSIIAIIGILGFQGIKANPVDSLTAKKAAGHFFAGKIKQSKNSPEVRIIETKVNKQGVSYYVLETSTSSAWLMLAGDDAIQPVLAYSEEGSFVDTGNPAFNWWLQEINSQIELYMKPKLSKSNKPPHVLWTALLAGPLSQEKPAYAKGYIKGQYLLTSKWNQTNHYAEILPENNQFTGCVATAMGQVVRYWGKKKGETALKGKGVSEYVDFGKGAPGIKRKVDFSERTYNLAGMPDSLLQSHTETAQLLADLGYSVRMNYQVGISSGSNWLIPSALFCHLGYKPSEYLKKDASIQQTVWEQRIKDEIKNERPVIYTGWDPLNAGHTFVVDGYKDDNTFHINWGWGGLKDGWFALALNTGDPVTNYNQKHDAIFGLEPYDSGNEFPYEITNLRFISIQNDCDTLNKYNKNAPAEVVFDIKNNSSQILSFSPMIYFYMKTPSKSNMYIGQDENIANLQPNENRTCRFPVVSYILSYLNEWDSVYFKSTAANFSFNMDIAVNLENPKANRLDIARTPYVIEKSTLSPIQMKAIQFAPNGKIAILWEKPVFLCQDSTGMINLYGKGSSAVMGSALSAQSGRIEIDFKKEESHLVKKYYITHEASGKTTQKSAEMEMPSYPQVHTITANFVEPTVTLNWSLTPSENAENEITGDLFEIECYANNQFSGTPLWTGTKSYSKGVYQYSLSHTFTQMPNVEYLHYRIRRTHTQTQWGWTMVSVAKVKTNYTPPAVQVTGVILKTSAMLSVNASELLNAEIKPSNASNKKLYWTSNNSTVVSVDSTGRVKALKEGTAIITVTTDDGLYTAECSVTVSIGSGIIQVDEEKKIRFVLYPNPAKDALFINSEEIIHCVSVIDLYGRIYLQSQTFTGTIPLTGLPLGIYLLRIQTPKGIFYQRFVKN